MGTPSREREPEAYIPPPPNGDEDHDWPPATRARAIEWARRQHIGLPVDDATLERVADDVLDAARSVARAARMASAQPPSSSLRDMATW